MMRLIISVLFGMLLVAGALLGGAWSGELKPIATQKTKDLVIMLVNESGQWTQGKNTFVLEFTSATTKQPVDAGAMTLNTTMPMPGMSPMVAGATLTPEQGPRPLPGHH